MFSESDISFNYNMERGDVKTLNEIDANTDRWTILVRVFRRWNICHRDSPKEVAATSMLLIDPQVM